jgi:hypothetical protein
MVDWIMDYLTCRRIIEHIPIICILDCCRSEIAMEDRGRGNLLNLQEATTNAFIMYATSSNKVAWDGEGANGTFTELLLKHIDMDAEITAIAIAIRNDLHKRSKGKQVGAIFTERAI